MKKLGKILALVLAASLVLSLVACGDKASDDKTLKLFGNVGSADGFSVLDEEIVQKFKEKTGITVELEYVASSGYQEKLQLMLASGEYPDAAVFPSTTTQAYIDSVENGILVDLKEYLTEENCPNLMKYTYDTAWEGVKFFGDDRIMAVPRTSLIRNEGIMLRADWLKAIGMGDILDREYHQVSADEFKEILKRMTFNDPDGNGKADTLGTSLWADDATKQYGPIEFARGFYGDYGWYAYEGDDYTYMMPQYSKKLNIYKNQLQYSADLYKDGVLDKDGPSLKKQDVNDRFNQGRFGVAPNFAGHIHQAELKLVEANNDQPCATNETFVDYIYAEDANGKVAGNGYYKPMWGQWGVFTSCADPNMFIQLCDFILSDEIWELVANGKEGVTHTIVDGLRENVKTQPGEQARGSQFPSGIVRKAGDAAYFTSNEKLDKKIATYFKPYLDKAFEISQATLVEQMDNGFNPSVSTDTKFINYQSKMAEQITKICTGALPVSEYDNVLDGWYAAGGQQYVEEMNEYIKKNQAQKAA